MGLWDDMWGSAAVQGTDRGNKTAARRLQQGQVCTRNLYALPLLCRYDFGKGKAHLELAFARKVKSKKKSFNHLLKTKGEQGKCRTAAEWGG